MNCWRLKLCLTRDSKLGSCAANDVTRALSRVRCHALLSTLAADRLGAEVHHQSANPGAVQVARAERLSALDARAARDEIEPHATAVAFSGHLGVHEDANALCH
jgi:hypothetical protein